jgi:TonB family protein
MKLSVFLFISVALHAAVLTYPVALLIAPAEELIPVVIVGSGDSEKGTRGDGRAERKANEAVAPRDRARGRQSEQREGAARTQSTESQELAKISISSVDPPAGTQLASVKAASIETVESSSAQPANGSSETGESDGSGISGSGTGSGIGQANKGAGGQFVQAHYVYSPKPQYPDRARREGREGRVLLRVLIDEEGRSKSVEVKRSSGSAALDRAATEAISQWRFFPAHSGDRPVESWVRIPIDFQLTDAQD